jgi:hypothetical protein
MISFFHRLISKEIHVQVAFVTYNRIGVAVENGWHETEKGRALVIQGKADLLWFRAASTLQEIPASLWRAFTDSIENFGACVLYIGRREYGEIISTLARFKPDQIILVLCQCNIDKKARMIRTLGMDSSLRITCECGGLATMERLYKDFLGRGDLPQRSRAAASR